MVRTNCKNNNKLAVLSQVSLRFPQKPLSPGEEMIDGIKFIFERVLNTGSLSTLVIKLPELGIVIARNVLYHNTMLLSLGLLIVGKPL